MYTDKSFERAYLQSLHLIKEDVDATEHQSQQEVKPEESETPGKCICFCTTDPNLIDVINSGFEKVVFSVKTTDGEETTDVEFGPEAFGEIEVKEQEETEECPECGKTPCECDDETCPECGKSPCECEDEDLDLDDDTEDECNQTTCCENTEDAGPVEDDGDAPHSDDSSPDGTDEGAGADQSGVGNDEVNESTEQLTEEDIVKECKKLRKFGKFYH